MAASDLRPEGAATTKEPPLTGKAIGLALLGDTLSALGASAMVAPFVSVIDKAIIQNAAGAASLETSLFNSVKTFVQRPVAFIKRPEVLMVWGVYGFTYTCANMIGTVCEVKDTSPDIPRLIGTTAANMGAGISKDRAYARMFGTVAPRALPSISYLYFFSRDLVTVGGSFNMPTPASLALQEYGGVGKRHADLASQLLCPVVLQLLTTPMHLAGLDCYNRPDAPMRDRWELLRSTYRKSVVARMARILPAWGFGGLGNKHLRGEYRTWMAQQRDSLPRHTLPAAPRIPILATTTMAPNKR